MTWTTYAQNTRSNAVACNRSAYIFTYVTRLFRRNFRRYIKKSTIVETSVVYYSRPFRRLHQKRRVLRSFISGHVNTRLQRLVLWKYIFIRLFGRVTLVLWFPVFPAYPRAQRSKRCTWRSDEWALNVSVWMANRFEFQLRRTGPHKSHPSPRTQTIPRNNSTDVSIYIFVRSAAG